MCLIWYSTVEQELNFKKQLVTTSNYYIWKSKKNTQLQNSMLVSSTVYARKNFVRQKDSSTPTQKLEATFMESMHVKILLKPIQQ